MRHILNTSSGSDKFAGICGYGKRERGIKNISFNVKIKQFFVAQNLSGNVIAFMGGSPLEGSPWISNISWDKLWARPIVKLLSNPIEMQTHFIQA